MIVALDTNSQFVTLAGTTRYVRGLLSGLRELNPPEVSISELAWEVENFGYRQPLRAMKTAYREAVWSRLVAPVRLLAMKADVLHRCTTSLPISKPPSVREIVTLHDLAVLRHPERFRTWHRTAEQRRYGLLQRADRILCDSRFTAEEAMVLLGLPASKLEVVYLGTGMKSSRTTGTKGVLPSVVPDDYLLFVGSLEPGKNLELLGMTYALADELRVVLPPLVIVGSRWPGVARERSIHASWVWLGFQPDSVLALLYEKARALVFPSKYEGFGLPVLEAMTLGCPVICSKVASLPEVAGEAARYAELTPHSYLAAMREIVLSDASREAMVLAGTEQSRRFSWRMCAEQVVDIYRKVGVAR